MAERGETCCPTGPSTGRIGSTGGTVPQNPHNRVRSVPGAGRRPLRVRDEDPARGQDFSRTTLALQDGLLERERVDFEEFEPLHCPIDG